MEDLLCTRCRITSMLVSFIPPDNPLQMTSLPLCLLFGRLGNRGTTRYVVAKGHAVFKQCHPSKAARVLSAASLTFLPGTRPAVRVYPWKLCYIILL